MSFVNTRTSLGEQAAFDALVAHTLTELNEDGINNLVESAVSYQDNLISVNFPNVTGLVSNSFYDNPLLETIDIGKQCHLQGYPITYCPKLKSLILRGTTGISTLSANTAFNATPIVLGICGIFVPRALISDYMSNSDWSNYASMIRAIEDMPITDFSTITHSWTQIKSMIDDESFFSSNYRVGDYKQFEYGIYRAAAEIAKIDSANKYVDFVLKYSNETIQRSSLKTRLDAIYANELPADLKTIISPISKKYNYRGEIETVNAPLWALYSKDLNLSGDYLVESEGEEYSLYDTNAKRRKYLLKSSVSYNTWWTGSYYGNSYGIVINANGNASYANLSSTYSLIFGFRIQKTT